ncbi:TPA: hypothetical protein ACNIFG_002234 [Acinetobacter baumannii]
MENNEDAASLIIYLVPQINKTVEQYSETFQHFTDVQKANLYIVPDFLRAKVISINEFSSLDNQILLKINNLTNIFKEIENQIELQSLKYISEKFLTDLYINLNNTFEQIKEITNRFTELAFITEQFQVQYDSPKKIHDSILEFGENRTLESINGIFKNFIDARNLLISKLDYAELLGKNINISVKQLIRIEEEIKSRESIISENLINIVESEKEKLIKIFNHEMKNHLNKIKNNFDDINLEIKALKDSSNLLSNSLDSNLKNAAILKERIQKIELEFTPKINEKFINIDKFLDSEVNKINEDLSKKSTEVDNQINAIRSRAITKSKRIKDAHNDFVLLVERAGIYELTQNYKNKSVEEKKDYNFFSWATIAAISLAIITTIVIIAIPIIEHWGANPPVETNYFTILARLSISLMFFVLAVYTSKQSSKHYECYQENHRTFLQLAALEPFMARMSEEEQKTIRKGLIPIYFNQNAEGKFATKGEELGMQFNMQAFVEKFFEVGKNITDKNNTDQSKPNG